MRQKKTHAQEYTDRNPVSESEIGKIGNGPVSLKYTALEQFECMPGQYATINRSTLVTLPKTSSALQTADTTHTPASVSRRSDNGGSGNGGVHL